MLKLIGYTLLVLFAALTFPAQAEHFEGRPGLEVVARAYCLTKGDAERLSAAAAKDGDAGYTRVMDEPKTRCYSVRRHPGVKHVDITLKRLAWTMVHKDGTEFEFWLAVDRTSRAIEGYVWFASKHVKGQPI